MKKLTLKEVKKYKNFIFQCEHKTYSFTMEFYDMPQPEVGDILIVNDEYLNTNSPNFVQSLYFEPLSEENAKRVNKFDIAGLHTKSKNYLLRRVYG